MAEEFGIEYIGMEFFEIVRGDGLSERGRVFAG